MTEDTYRDLADRYDLMKRKNPDREEFFRRIFAHHDIKNVLDCACGTGNDLLLFNSLGLKLTGSDLSAAMLGQADFKLKSKGLDIPLVKADFRKLTDQFERKFDAVVCLSNSINELLDDIDAIQALRSMKEVLKPGGICIIDQAQTDALMKNPPRFSPVVNERDFSRLFVQEYFANEMVVNIFDFIHTESVNDFKSNSVRLAIRLQHDWANLFDKAGFSQVDYLGSWLGDPYDKVKSMRLIMVGFNHEGH